MRTLDLKLGSPRIYPIDGGATKCQYIHKVIHRISPVGGLKSKKCRLKTHTIRTNYRHQRESL